RRRAAPPARGGARTQARLLDPCGRVAARRARAVRARDAFTGDAPPPGPVAACGRYPRARRPRRRPCRPLAAALGPPLADALVRAPRRGHHTGRVARARGCVWMRVWLDLTASAHPLVYRPLVELLRARGDEVEITARDYAQTLQ